MKEAVFSFSSTTQVIQGETLLREAGFSVQVMPLPPAIRAGCGLCLRLPMDEHLRAQVALRHAELMPAATFIRTQTDSGNSYEPLEEVPYA